MKQILLFFTCLLLVIPSFARGHGHGGGGHSSAHSSGAGHSSGHSHMTSVHSSSTHSINTGGIHASGSNHTATRTVITRSTSPRIIATHHARNLSATIGTSSVNHSRNGKETNHTPAYPFYGYGYYNRTDYSNPFFYNPYIYLWWVGMNFTYTPNYYPASAPVYAGNSDNNIPDDEPLDGYVVFYNDTLSGAVLVNKRSISLETTDSGKNYDYDFHTKNPGLQYVTAYNDDDKQLTLVRLNGDNKKLWRVVHTGKLNIYDTKRAFIYKPEDIDVKTLTVVYNGATASLNSFSTNATKEWLTQYVNQAYALSLDPKNFTWEELLIYVDKLD